MYSGARAATTLPDRVSRARRLLLGLSIAAAVLGAAEVLVRPWVRRPPKAEIRMAEDPTFIWTLTSYSAAIRPNALGMRGPDLGPKPPGTRRILTLGDSSVFGDGVGEAEVFSEHVARRLTGGPVQAANGAVPGYSTVQSLRFLAKIAPSVDPDLVIIGNLWSDATPSDETDEEHLARLAPGTSPVGAAWDWADAHSGLFRVVWNLSHGNTDFANPVPYGRKVGWVHADRLAAGGTRVPTADYRANLGALVDAARDWGTPVLLLLPHPFDDRGQALPAALTERRAVMREVAAERGVPLVDGEAWFKAHPAQGARFWDDIHPNAAGHAALADAVLDVLAHDPRAAF